MFWESRLPLELGRSAAYLMPPFLPPSLRSRTVCVSRYVPRPIAPPAYGKNSHPAEVIALVDSYKLYGPSYQPAARDSTEPNLAPDTQGTLLFLPKIMAGPDPITERRLRSIAQTIIHFGVQAVPDVQDPFG